MNPTAVIVDEAAELVPVDDYLVTRRLASGELAGVQRMAFTYGLMVGLDRWGYRTRFCFPTLPGALAALATWDGTGDPPGDWIKEKPADRPNPKLGGIPIVAAHR